MGSHPKYCEGANLIHQGYCLRASAGTHMMLLDTALTQGVTSTHLK